MAAVVTDANRTGSTTIPRGAGSRRLLRRRWCPNRRAKRICAVVRRTFVSSDRGSRKRTVGPRACKIVGNTSDTAEFERKLIRLYVHGKKRFSLLVVEHRKVPVLGIYFQRTNCISNRDRTKTSRLLFEQRVNIKFCLENTVQKC